MDEQCHRDQVQALFVREASRIRGFIIGLMPDLTAADDVFQEVFLTVSRKTDDFVLGSDFQAWVRAIARLKVLEACRARRYSLPMLEPDVIDLVAAAAPPHDADLWERRQLALGRCLDHIAPQARRITELRYVQNLLPDQVAERLSWTTNAVNVALSRVRKHLRECIQQRIAVSEA
jgi:RNA polymerase sigma-70 factor, ECF subfamily